VNEAERHAEQDRLLAWAARRARGREAFVASALASYQELHQLDDAALAAWLGLPEPALADLALCLRPAADAPSFRADVERIAAHVGASRQRLAKLLREADAVTALRAAPAPGGRQAGQGILKAARDRRDGDGSGDGTGGDDQRP
jgi:hypothetical protein